MKEYYKFCVSNFYLILQRHISFSSQIYVYFTIPQLASHWFSFSRLLQSSHCSHLYYILWCKVIVRDPPAVFKPMWIFFFAGNLEKWLKLAVRFVNWTIFMGKTWIEFFFCVCDEAFTRLLISVSAIKVITLRRLVSGKITGICGGYVVRCSSWKFRVWNNLPCLVESCSIFFGSVGSCGTHVTCDGKSDWKLETKSL